ncbi:hypothetical protein [Devosia sp. RR2S18]|uniref:hypothetical protein n=1 Tax=Devosia rhizosphaerae TaxID=3049774 RepID=UPI002541791A|nr:hypothetical protein [Devosia sp. RR2S18]WIJ24224.1 hypothetical protein QOV41_14545 [Devosia sp. RR2S18]
MRNITTVTIPTERHQQLVAIGETLKLSMAETIARFVRREIESGTIPADLPGIKVERLADGVRITLGQNTPTTFTKASAADLAAAIERAATGQPINLMDLDSNFVVERRGNGVKVSVPFEGEARAFSRDVAEDFAKLVRQAS